MQPIKLSDEAMSAVLAASHPIAPDRRADFLADVARELAALPLVGDGIVHRVITVVQRKYFDPPRDTGFDISHRGNSKLASAPPIEHDGPDRRARSSR